MSQTNELRVVVFCHNFFDDDVARKVGLESVLGSSECAELIKDDILLYPKMASYTFYGKPVWISGTSSETGIREQWNLYCEAVVRGADIAGVIIPPYRRPVDWSALAYSSEESLGVQNESIMRGAAIFWEAEKQRRRECPLRPIFGKN